MIFLASGLASYITGATRFVGGGQRASKLGTWTEDTADFPISAGNCLRYWARREFVRGWPDRIVPKEV